MSRQILCEKLKQNLDGLERAPFPGALGEKIYQAISKQAWKSWLDHQTILINEYRLNLLDPQSKRFLQQEMQNFLFGNGSEKPAAFRPEEKE